MATTYDVNGEAFGWNLRTAARVLDESNVPRFEVERGAPQAVTLSDILAAGRQAVIVAIVKDARRERDTMAHLRTRHGLTCHTGRAFSPGGRVTVHFILSDSMERTRGIRGDVVVGRIQPSWEDAPLLDPRGMNIRVDGEQAERAFWGMAEQGAPSPPMAPVLMVNGHRCPASLRVDVAVAADDSHGPTWKTVDISGEVADGEPFVACVASACRTRGVVVVSVALGDGKSTALQGFVDSFGMAGHRLTAKLVCAPVRARSAATLPEAFFDTSCASMTPEAKRRAAEAPLVALVAAVPKGLDPIGWQAAVLAFVENAPQDKAVRECALSHVNEAGAVIEGFVLDGAEPTAIRPHPDDRVTFTAATMWAVCDAYARAVAPQGPRPAPERRKSPGLPLDVDAELAGLDARAGR